ncbi:TonB-dependent receptor [Sinomicrobium kalidii]|uniref:TonB-dependent receptor n=1 Tax=Sinomicrobium kalidii TaxID=2900738 RepID=UPI001E43D517|nr:TonB-dependent receptor [Sinomicrobium kalidii]UGU16465.1 TonB-dependent receptor [Sinomicrobium kalidii]
MKIYDLILMVTCCICFAQANPASTTTNNINLNFERVSLGQLFASIEAQTNYQFAYGTTIKNKAIRNVHVSDEDIETVLRIIERKTSLAFNIIDYTIAVYEADVSQNQKAPAGSVRGRVYDAGDVGEPLAGASIIIRELNHGVAADSEGFFRIDKIPEGKHILEVSFLGYTPRRIAIEVIADNITELNIGLKESTSELEEVVITAPVDVRYAPVGNSTEESLVSTIRSSPVVVTGISNEQISRSFDLDAGEVVRRVPGVSLLDNFVVLRGMSPRYNLTMLNGMVTPSTEMDTRAFSYNLLPSSVIDQMMVHKSPSPELPGNFGGGVVKIQTKNTAVARRLEVNYLQQYRTMGSSLSHYYTYEGSDKDWYGGGVEDRELPDILRDPTYTIPDIDKYPDEIARVGAQMPDVRTPQRKYYGMDMRAYLNYNDSWKIGSVRLNNLTYINYETQRQFVKTDLAFGAGSFSVQEDGDIIDFNNGIYTDSLYTERIRLSAMQNLSLLINDDHKIDLTSFATRRATDDLYNREGTDEADFRSKIFSYRYNVRDLFQAQLSGDHQIGKHHIHWAAGYNKAYDNMPDLQRYKFIGASVDSLWTPEFNTQGDNYNTRISFDTDEEAKIYQLDYTKDFTKDIKLKVGGYLEQRDRSFNSYVAVIEAAAGESDPDLVDISNPAPWSNVIDTLYTQFQPGRMSLKSPIESAYPGRYSFDDEIRAGYAAVTIPLFNEKLKIHAGARFEWNKRLLYDENGQTIDSVVVDRIDNVNVYEETPNKIQDFILPSINITYNISDRTAIRAAYGRTIDRPQYREQSNFKFHDFEAGFNVASNPLLLNAEIDNYDIRVEHYPSPSEFLAVGAFYKRLKNAIEMYDRSTAGWSLPLMYPFNTELAEVYGVELEIRKNLGFIAPFFKDISTIINGTLVESRIDFNGRNRPLQGTSPYLLNAGLYYGQQDSPTKVSVMYNVIGRRLRIAEGANNSDVGALYERRRHLVDVTFSRQLTKNLLLKAGVQNLLNAPFRFYRDGNQNEKYDPGYENAKLGGDGGNTYRGDYMEREFKEGSYITFGLSLTL